MTKLTDSKKGEEMTKLATSHINKIHKMKTDGMDFDQIADYLRDNNFTSGRGRKLTAGRVRSFYANNKYRIKNDVAPAPQPKGDVTPLMIAEFVWKTLSDEKKCSLVAELIKKSI